MKNLLIDKVEEFQQKYLNLLKVILKEINNHEINIRDEFLIFFNKNKMLLELYLKYYSQEEMNYFLTGFDFINVEKGEHKSFFLIDGKRIIDDTLYLDLNLLGTNSEVNKQIYIKKIKKSIENNIFLLEKYNSEILLMPIRCLNSKETFKDLSTLSNKILFQFFKKEYVTFEEYIKENLTIKDIENNLIINTKMIIFLKNEDKNDSFQKRFENYKKNIQSIGFETKNDGLIFYMAVFGFLSQAINIIEVSERYNLFPCVRNYTTIYYIALIFDSCIQTENINYIKQKNNILNTLKLFFIFQNILENSNFFNFPTEEIIKMKNQNNWWTNIMKEIELNKENSLSLNTIEKIILKKMENVLKL
ncbi:hypothetical protein HMPREF0202_00961 [Cetobacterium somerae ATCC BAA-474]|uniref:Uncharacterized protein n=1 Tax=Cetobacterium somerae ATCC BAA-474 TaxID=1319815 RepID=U7VEB2_9FUSO|nr:hypothetical protein [Cetobacterium somerae]ERT69128.1 hypothetical protein HMPREF0202_00961 [Cetobacterium somerae ATCC BAA-474]